MTFSFTLILFTITSFASANQGASEKQNQHCDFMEPTRQIRRQFCYSLNDNDSLLMPMLATSRAVVLQCSKLQTAICQRSKFVNHAFRHLKRLNRLCLGTNLMDKLNGEVGFYQSYCSWL